MNGSVVSAEFPVYLDNHATTPLDPDVLQEMLPFLQTDFGNPSSRHHVYGQRAQRAVESARERVAALIGARPDEIIFTSGATESNNLALRGAAEANRARGTHLLTWSTEHKAVLEPLSKLAQEGFDLTVLPVLSDGLIDLGLFRNSLRPDTSLVSAMQANNEIGVIQPIREISEVCREAGIIFHTDAAQSVGKLPIDLSRCHVDLMSVSGHKIYGPKGVGALYVRRRRPRLRVEPLIFGGGHERGLRSGTLNTPAVVGLGAACSKAQSVQDSEGVRLSGLRERLVKGLSANLGEVSINGHFEKRLPGNLNVRLPGVDSEALLYSLKQVALSSGSACTSLKVEPSHVLLALGLSEGQAMECLRFGLGRFTTPEQIDLAIVEIVDNAKRIRQLRAAHMSPNADDC